MRKLALLLVCICVALAYSPETKAQTWVNILAPTSGAGACTFLASGTYAGCGIRWDLYSGVPGGIPSLTWTQSGSTILAATYGNGASDATSGIQTALTACSGNKYVLLGAGTFLIDGNLLIGSGCELRGNGANSTILNTMGTAGPTVCLGSCNGNVGTGTIANVTGGATAGSTSLTVSSASGITTNTNLYISELNYLPFVRITGDEGSGGGGFCVFGWGPAAGFGRARCQIVTVTNVTGTTITVSPPLFTDYTHTLPNWAATTQYPWEAFITNGGHWYSQTVKSTTSPYICTSGGTTPAFSTSGGSVSDGTCTWLDNGTGTTTQPQVIPYTPSAVNAGVNGVQVQMNQTRVSGNIANFYLAQCSGCWVENSEGNYTDGDHVLDYQGFRNSIMFNYFSNTFSHTSGNYDSSPEFQGGTTGDQFVSNICDRLHVGCILLEWGAAGNVVAYNYATGQFAQSADGPNFTLSAVDFHSPHPQLNLSEGNAWQGVAHDSTWGSNSHDTSFRDWMWGTNTVCLPNSNSRTAVTCSPFGFPGQSGKNSYESFQQAQADIFAFTSSYNNVIGAIIGSPAAQAAVNTSNNPIPQNTSIVWSGIANRNYEAFYGLSFGFANSSDGNVSVFPLDNTTPFVTALLHGIFNNVDGSITWQAGITHTLPASFYLSSQPPWWISGIPWPAIGPDLTTGSAMSGHVASASTANPAQNCYLNIMGGADGGNASPLTFNAASCYPLSGMVATPTFSPGAGSYSSAQTVTISTSTGGATLCYTTDGSTPTEVANACSGGTTQTYTTPITVSTSETVKALGTLSGLTDSSVGSALYTITLGIRPAPATNMMVKSISQQFSNLFLIQGF